MSNEAEVAVEAVNIGLNGMNVALRLSTELAEQFVHIFFTVIQLAKNKDAGQRLSEMMRQEENLSVFSVADKDLKSFTTYAKNYGIEQCLMKDRKAKNGLTYAIVRESDAPKIGRILERMQMEYVKPESLPGTEQEEGKTEQEEGKTEQEKGKTEQKEGKQEQKTEKAEQEEGKKEKQKEEDLSGSLEDFLEAINSEPDPIMARNDPDSPYGPLTENMEALQMAESNPGERRSVLEDLRFIRAVLERDRSVSSSPALIPEKTEKEEIR